MKLTFAIFITGLILLSCNKRKESNDTLEISKLKVSYSNQILDNSIALSTQLDILADRVNSYTTTFSVTHYNLSRSEWQNSKRMMEMLVPFQYLNEVDFYSYLENPAYIDATSYDNSSGIIVNTSMFPSITAASIGSVNFAGSSNQNISKGIHALEFMLWGEDENSTGPGVGGQNPYDPNATANFQRRINYMRVVTNLMRTDLTSIDYAAFKAELNAKSNEESLQFILKGIHNYIVFNCAEKAIKKPIDFLDQKYEESQFSDNSTEDLKNKIVAIKYFLNGSQFDSTDGYFLMDFMREKSPELAGKVETQLDGLYAKTQDFEFVFDVAIQNPGQRAQLMSLYDDLIALGSSIEQFANERGVSL